MATPKIDRVLKHEIDLGSFPSAVYAIGTASGIFAEGVHGHAVSVPMRIRSKLDTIYDCASLTKPLITTTLVLQAVVEGRIALDDRFHGYTYRELLTHTTGLRAWMPLYAHGDYLATILKEGPEYARGTKVVYSDLNFILLWYALKDLFGDYVAAAKARIFEPLGVTEEAMFNPPVTLRTRIAATEWGQRHEAKMANQPAPRDGLIWGETHDGNSFFAGGTAGNAGLFGTLHAVFRIAQGWLNDELLPREMVAEAMRNHTPGLDDARGYGWQLATSSDATRMLTPEAVGHTGFTGTSLWIDKGRVMLLLTNRVHPCAAPIPMQKIRGEFHRLAIQVKEKAKT